jgi:glycosyltransferase involved in cell wall biosynthesis
MRVLVLSKRQYMGKDLLDDAYGRFYELPLELARHGHAVQGLCASYRRRPEGEVVARREGAEVRWRALRVRPYSVLSLRRWVGALDHAASSFGPDVVWACSDSFHAILGAWLQRRHGVPCAIDLYDNFESYAATRIPGVRSRFRAAVRDAAGVTCVSPALEDYVRERYAVRGGLQVLENGMSAHFVPHDRALCRRRLKLPLQAKIVGTAGAIDRSRGIEELFEAFLRLVPAQPDLHLLLAGRIARGTRVPRHERIVYLGQLDHAEVPYVMGAMDVCVVCNRRSAFGDYVFPQKLYEAIACGVPPLVARTPGVASLLRAAPGHGYEPGSLESLIDGIKALLARPTLPPIPPRSWADIGATLHAFLKDVSRKRRA